MAHGAQKILNIIVGLHVSGQLEAGSVWNGQSLEAVPSCGWKPGSQSGRWLEENICENGLGEKHRIRIVIRRVIFKS